MSVKNLVVVESPGKIKTISKFLGKDYKVMASLGHVRDLPKSKMGVDVEDDFKPVYQISPDKKKVISSIKKEIGKDTTVWIATDEDREGEAIGWHLTEALQLKKGPKLKRIVFHEITKPAILGAIESPRDIDKNKVDAQQARRVLDRLVGYTLSPLLWKKVQYGLSAGRVQSVAVRLIVEREREIEAFVPVEYWHIVADLEAEEGRFEAKLIKKNGKKFEMGKEKEAQAVLDALKGANFKIESITQKSVKRNPAPPFTTSTLQQEAARKLGFSVRKTMTVAQRLYEGVDLPGGHEGLITYMRTDSVNLSNTALTQAKEVILKEYGKEYALDKPRFYKGKKGAQEAHEAIRPTQLSRLPDEVKKYLEPDMFKLYSLIWKRTLACQMQQAILNQVAVDVAAVDYTFRATGQSIEFPGFMKVYLEGRDDPDEDKEDQEALLPSLKEGEDLKLHELISSQHFTKPPARYTEASLVKKLEAEGIGRPSTYAPTISTIQTRGYIERVEKTLRPTDIGRVVNDFLVEHFPKILDYSFTVRMEEMLDEVEEGKEDWTDEVREFYEPFHKRVESKEESVSRADVLKARELGTDPKSGKPVSVRIGRYGPFVQIGTKEDEEKPQFAPLPKELDMQKVELKDVMHLFDLPRVLGEKDGEKVKANVGRFGPYVQVGKTYYSIKEDDPYTISFERALEVIKAEEERKAKALILEFKDEDIRVLEGRYGPYIKHGKTNAKIPKDRDPAKLTLEDCQKILAEAPKKRGFRRGKKS